MYLWFIFDSLKCCVKNVKAHNRRYMIPFRKFPWTNLGYRTIGLNLMSPLRLWDTMTLFLSGLWSGILMIFQKKWFYYVACMGILCLCLSVFSCNEHTFVFYSENLPYKLCFMQTFYKIVQSWASKKFMTGW